jgi:beta-fructofuranosidase
MRPPPGSPTRRQFLAGTAASITVSRARGADSDPDLIKAMEAVRKAIPLASADPDRPVYHFHPPANWNNDPNGTLYYRGWHHLFYQLNPFGTNIANQHWGHARSKDLVNWEHLPIAIAPSPEKGERAIFSGGAIIADDGRPRLIYTSIGHTQPEQWMVVPQDDDLVSWRKFAGNPVLTSAAHGALTVNQWRDPFLFREAGRVYMVCGGNANRGRGGAGQVQLYRAVKADLSEWKHLGVVFQALERETYNIECPNLFQLDGKWVLIVSPHRPCEYFVGSLDIDRVKFTPETHGILDAGPAYASNISHDDQGRTILWLWGRTNTPQGRGWNGVMTMPRILSVRADGFLRQQVPREFETLRGAVKTFPPRPLGDSPVPLEGVPGDAAEIEAEFSTSNFSTFGFEVSRSGKLAITLAIEGGWLTVGNARAYIGNTERYKLRVFLDKRCLEVYVEDGAVALYNFLDAQPGNQAISVFARMANPGFGNSGGNRRAASVRLESLKVWPMKPASFKLDHFHV